MAWSDLAHTTLEPGRYDVRLRAVAGPSDDAIQNPVLRGTDNGPRRRTRRE